MDDDDEFENYIATADLDSITGNIETPETKRDVNIGNVKSRFLKTQCLSAAAHTVQSDDVNTNEGVIKDSVLPIPATFPFPFQPYDIQVAFMQNLFTTLQQSKIGIFESPTGTGKSMSLICGSVLWLKMFEEQREKDLKAFVESERQTSQEASKSGADDWIGEFVKKQEIKEKTSELKDKLEAMKRKDERLKMIRDDSKKRKRNVLDDQFDELFKNKNFANNKDNSSSHGDNGNDDVLMDEYVSDDDNDDKVKKRSDLDSDDEEEKEEEEEHVTKIYYCSRTHSQLTQFINEVKRSPHNDVKVTALGSRMNMCINSAVRRLASLNLMNEACRDMADKGKKGKKDPTDEPSSKKIKPSSTSSCPFYKHATISDLTDQILTSVMDIEEMVVQGGKVTACPYYASRRAVPTAQLVVLPYNTLLHKGTREASGIHLKGHVVVLDEGHNLLDTISNIHSVTVTAPQFASTHNCLLAYLQRYSSRLSAKNIMYLKQLSFLFNACLKLLTGNPKAKKPTNEDKIGSKTERISGEKGGKEERGRMVTINDFLFESKLDHLNFFKIKRFCAQSQIAKKLHGFAMRQSFAEKCSKENIDKNKKTNKIAAKIDSSSEPPSSSSSSSSSSMHVVESLVEALFTFDNDGRIFLTKSEEESSIKFLLLNPASHFKQVVQECRSVIIAGGTMQPVDDFKRQLLFSTGVSQDRVHEFSCGHVISREQLLPISLARGVSGDLFDFTYQNRDTANTLKELSLSLIRVCTIVPDGVVCFLPSYDYKSKVVDYMQKNGFTRRLEENKKIFDEPRKSSEVEKVLSQYSGFIEKCASSKECQNGAVLLCVVGGKMSEGINFSDALARCVVMVGLPYPNIHSVTLKEKVDYLNNTMGRSGDGRMAGQVHVENLCMKATNQSIGRAIRHRYDYASILLLDNRYTRPQVRGKLPTWISSHLRCEEHFNSAMKELREFFNNKT